MKPQPQGHVMDNPYHPDDIKPDAMLGNKARSPSQYQDGETINLIKAQIRLVDISDELLAEIIVRKLCQGYNSLEHLIYEQQPLLTDKIIAKIEDYIQDSGNPSNTVRNNIKNESTFFNKIGPFCKNGVRNPLTKHLAKDCQQLKKKKGKRNSSDKSEKVKHTETIQFKESDSSDNESHVVKFSKAFNASSNSSDASIYLDSAASYHMVGSLDSFCHFKRGSFRVETANRS
ncbi:hypothetical protein O181_067189 [Austropuccinia psidii MF-1]|uniref:Uncharacterized protein n=1 Tax=Austropuccinia psidii MF-1 TaxID=1389203 RepID=A0A9Q3EUF1_9BASI|nr:hypothetical protein [Austropuccinia psidii MF-1]